MKIKKKSFTDTLTIGADHAILMGHVPERINNQENITNLVNNFFSWNKSSKDSVQSLGLFGSDIDYNTYYPDLKPEDLVPKDNEFIEPMFRLLSATIVSKNYYPTDFSLPGVLKNSMNLMLGQTVNCDHATDIGNAIGSVSKVVWQEAYKDGDILIPAGINGILKIDGKSNPRIARGILMEPPSIHSNSVTVQFRWEKSHPELSDDEFYDKIGTYDDKGELIRRMVTEIVRYTETSLVSHGADVYAQKIGEDGKIVNPKYANRVWNSYSEVKPEENNSTHNTYNYNNNTTNKNQETMKLEEFLAKLFGDNMLSLNEGEQPTAEKALELVKSLIESKTTLLDSESTLKEQVTNLTSEVTNLKASIESSKDMVELGKSYITELRENVLNNYKKICKDSLDEKDPIVLMINSDTTPVITLQGLNKSYTQRLEELYPLTCSKCGSKDVSRSSSFKEDPEGNNGNDSLQEPLSTAEATQKIVDRKLKQH